MQPSPSTSHCLTPIALGRLALSHYVWENYHHLIQRHLLLLLTKQLRFSGSHPKAGQLCKRLMILVGPQHGKSTLTSQLLPAIALAQNPRTKLILLSYSADLAAAHSQVARDRVIEFGKHLAPDGSVQLKTDSKARNAWYTTAGGYVRSASIQGTVTGLAANGIIIDDPFKGPEDSGSPTQRDKVWRTYSSVVETRLAPDGFACLINTPWHPDDLCGRLLASEPDDWMVIRLPALAEENDVLGRAPGDPLSRRYGLDWYHATRAKLEARGLGHLWQALYMCDPTGDPSLRAFNDASYFGEHLFVDCLPLSEDNPELYRVLALDPCKSKTGKVGDYAAFADLTVLKDNRVYADMTLLRPTLPVLHATAIALVQRAIDEGRPYRAMIVECNQFQQAVAVAIAKELNEKNIMLHVEEHHTGSDQEKNARMVVGLSPYLSNRKLKFIGKSLSNRLTVRQMEEIPSGAHDDGPDSIELGVQLLNLIHLGTKRPIQQKVLRT